MKRIITALSAAATAFVALAFPVGLRMGMWTKIEGDEDYHPISTNRCLCITSVDGGSIMMTNFDGPPGVSIYYSDDDRETWKKVVWNLPISVSAGRSLYFLAGPGGNAALGVYNEEYKLTEGNYNFEATSGTNFVASGSVMSLLNCEIEKAVVGNSALPYLFYGMSSLRKAPEITSAGAGVDCYRNMFEGTGITQPPPVLPATNVLATSYFAMFADCIDLTESPDIKAVSIVGDYCIAEMFRGCSKLSKIKIAYEGELNDDISVAWVEDVAPSGTIYYNGPTSEEDISKIPVGWTREHYNP